MSVSKSSSRTVDKCEKSDYGLRMCIEYTSGTYMYHLLDDRYINPCLTFNHQQVFIRDAYELTTGALHLPEHVCKYK